MVQDGLHTLVVDAANVVGARPDGWWRDRPGAARRLHDQLAAADLPYQHVVLVLEGRARVGVPEGRARGVETVYAVGAGDDELVRQCRLRVADGEVTLVTADRALAQRVAGVAAVLGPRWLLARLLPDED